MRWRWERLDRVADLVVPFRRDVLSRRSRANLHDLRDDLAECAQPTRSDADQCIAVELSWFWILLK